MTKSGETVRRLHRIWRQREDLESRLNRGPRAVAAAEASHAAAVRALQAHRDAIRAKKMDADRKQLQMREREAKLYDLEVKMNMSKADREYQTLKGQIAADTQANRVLTDEILELLEQIDALEARTDEYVAAEQAEAAEAAEATRRVEAARVGLETDLTRVLSELADAEKDISGDLRTAYQRISTTLGGDAIAPLEDGSCGGCNTSLSPRLVDRIEMGEGVLCTSCGRLVYPA